MRPIILTYPAVIFSKGNIQRPVQAVFYAPVSAGDLQQSLGRPGQTADIVARVDRGPGCRLPLSRDLNHGVEVGPLLPVLQIVQAVRVRDDPALTGFQAAVALVQRAGEVIGDALEVVFLGALEKVANVIVRKCSDLRGSEQPAAFQEGIETSGPPGAKEGCQGHLAVGALP